jgi:hypothetical protein
MLKITNVQNVYMNNKKVTLFDVYQLIDKTWIFDYNSSIKGWYNRNKTIATKHCAENEVLIDLKDWEF